MAGRLECMTNDVRMGSIWTERRKAVYSSIGDWQAPVQLYERSSTLGEVACGPRLYPSNHRVHSKHMQSQFTAECKLNAAYLSTACLFRTGP